MKTLSVLLAAPVAALAHEGHGLAAGHWHATDVWGFVALGVGFAAMTVWWSRRK